MSGALPTIVFGHGSPMNAVLTNSYTEAWRGIGADIPQTGGHSGDLRPLVHAGNRRDC